MAILKHIANKSSDYANAQHYLIFQHDEYTGKPVLDENGKMTPRQEYYLDGILCDPFTFDIECKELNTHFHKNKSHDEIKSHHYIISFDPKDCLDRGLTGERAQQLGLEYAEKNFPGHQALVCTHMDGHNGSGNIHVHIIINSLRKYDVERQNFMERVCDSRAGYKHHLTNDYLVYLKQSLMDMCNRENLHQVDLLTSAERKVTEKEYWAKRRGQKKLEKENRPMIADGIAPRKTKFETEKEFLRNSIDSAASRSGTLEEFQQELLSRYNIRLKISRGRYSYLHPNRTKPITGRNLGTHYEKHYLLERFAENIKAEKTEEQKIDWKSMNNKAMLSPKQEPSSGQASSSKQNCSFMDEKWNSILFIKSDLHLVVELQDCIKAKENAAYAQKVKLSNLKEMAKTVAYIQEHGYDTRQSLESTFSKSKKNTDASRDVLKYLEDRLQKVNEQIHYTGQYFANKSIYTQFCKSGNKSLFRKEHYTEIALYETARKFLKEHSSDGKLPSLKLLKAEKAKLLEEKKDALTSYRYYKDFQKELHTVCSNVDAILGKMPSRQPVQNRSKEIR